MDDTGLELTAKPPMHQPISERGGAESGAVDARNGQIAPDLAVVIDAWPTLPKTTTADILALVKAAGVAT